MTYERKKPDRVGGKVLEKDLKHLKRIYAKYGETSFNAACAKIKNLPARGAGQAKRYEGNLISILIAVDENVERLGLTTADVLSRMQVPRHSSGKNYTHKGLKSIYYKAAKLLITDPRFAEMVRQFRSARSNPERVMVIGGPVPAGLVRGPTIPIMLKVKSE